MLYAARRFAIFAASLLAASVAVFTLLQVLPGDPAQTILGVQATPEQLTELRKHLGLDAPAVVRYFDWLGGLLSWHLGRSYISDLSISSLIGDRVAVTGPLVLLSSVIALAVAVPLGTLAAVGHRRPLGTVVSGLSQVGIAVPEFWAGILFITIVAVRLRWLPAGGFVDWSQSVGQALRSLLLPALSLAVVQAAILTRYVRSAVLDVMREDYIRTARMKGHSLRSALWRHGLRNASIPVVTVLGLQLAGLLAGAVVVENVFSLPGLGKTLLDAIGGRDLLLVQDIVMVLTAAVLLVNFLVDLLYHVLDPRLRQRAR